MEVRLALTGAEIDAAQALRYRVFYEEMAARPSARAAATRRDSDPLDEFCDHLIVLDHAQGDASPSVVATCRLIRRPAAEREGGFYSAGEYDIAPLLSRPGELLELGRSCVHPDYRARPAMPLLWRGIAAYVFRHGVELMFGCASLPGTDPAGLALPLSYLHHFHLAPEDTRARALADRYVRMDLLPKEAIDPGRALWALPPLIKGYLRLGGSVGDGAVIDPQFNTTDVCVVVKTDRVAAKYLHHYERTAREPVAA